MQLSTEVAVPDPADPGASAPSELDALFRTGRGFVPNLFRSLGASPGVAEGWAQLGNALRHCAALDERSRELAILLVAHRTGSRYEWTHHARVCTSMGISAAQLQAVQDWPDPAAWDDHDGAVLAFVAAALAGEPMPAAARTRLEAHGGRAYVVELAATTAYYTAVAQVAAVLEVEPDAVPDR